MTREGVLFGLPMPLTFQPPIAMTDAELIAFSRRNRPYRIERNASDELEIMSPVGFEGGRRETFAGRILGNWAEGHGGVCASASTGFTLPDGAVRSPDASWMSNDRVSRPTDEERRGFAPVCPEFLIEILSETDSRRQLEAKMQMWMANGAQLAWMIDPYAATVSIYRSGAAVEVVERPESGGSR